MANTNQSNITVTTSAANFTITHSIGRTPHVISAQILAAAITGFIMSEVSKDATFVVVNCQASANAAVRITSEYIHSSVR